MRAVRRARTRRASSCRWPIRIEASGIKRSWTRAWHWSSARRTRARSASTSCRRRLPTGLRQGWLYSRRWTTRSRITTGSTPYARTCWRWTATRPARWLTTAPPPSARRISPSSATSRGGRRRSTRSAEPLERPHDHVLPLGEMEERLALQLHGREPRRLDLGLRRPDPPRPVVDVGPRGPVVGVEAVTLGEEVLEGAGSGRRGRALAAVRRAHAYVA